MIQEQSNDTIEWDAEPVPVLEEERAQGRHVLGAMSLSLLKFAGQASLVDEAMLPS